MRPRGSTAAGDGPDRPPLDSVARLLSWQAGRQRATLAGGILFGVVWMLCQALWPYALGRAIDDGVEPGGTIPWLWCMVLLGIALLQAASGILRHRMAVFNWLASSLGIARLVGHHSADTGPAITATTASGEIVTTVASDSLRMGEMFDIIARLSGSVVAYAAVSVIMLSSSLPLGLAALIGIPALGLVMVTLIRPLQRRQADWRREAGLLTTLGADTVVGLRVLRGIGGENEFVQRYARRSQQLRIAGNHVARTQSWLDGLQILLPGLFLTFVVWSGARLVLHGAMTAGELVTFYGYASFLVLPLRTGVEAAQTFTRGIVAAQHVLNVLRIPRATSDRHGASTPPPHGADLVDVASGLVVRPGRFTAIVDSDPDAAAAVATRLGRFDDAVHRDAPVLWGGIDHTTVPVAAVRDRIVVSGANPYLFAGPLLDELDVQAIRDADSVATTTGRIRRVNRALKAASAAETVDALPGGLAAPMSERGRSFSGGQRQRLSLARALLTDAEVLILIEPTSAVDSYTEAEIAAQLHSVREGRTTVFVSASPLLLEIADEVAVLRRGHVLGTGTHAELLRRDDDLGDAYRQVVARSSSSAEPAAEVNLEAAWTGSIDTLWSDAVQTGAIAVQREEPDQTDAEDDGAASDR